MTRCDKTGPHNHVIVRRSEPTPVDEARAALQRVRGFPKDAVDGFRRWQPDERGAYVGFEDAVDVIHEREAATRAESAQELAALREAVLDNIEAFPGSDLCRYCQNLLSDGHSFDCVVVKARALAATPADARWGDGDAGEAAVLADWDREEAELAATPAERLYPDPRPVVERGGIAAAPTPREVLAVAMSVIEHRAMAHIGIGGADAEAGPQTLRDADGILAYLEREGFALVRREPLDVEVLARAIHEYSHLDSEGECDAVLDARELAKRYARLEAER